MFEDDVIEAVNMVSKISEHVWPGNEILIQAMQAMYLRDISRSLEAISEALYEIREDK